MGPSGEAQAYWNPNRNGFVSTQPAGGAFAAAPLPSSSGVAVPANAHNASGGDGSSLVAYVDGSGMNTVTAAERPAGGSFGTPAPVSPPGDVTSASALGVADALDPAGDGAVTWPDSSDAVRVALGEATSTSSTTTSATSTTTPTTSTTTTTSTSTSTAVITRPAAPNTRIRHVAIDRRRHHRRETISFAATGAVTGFECAVVKLPSSRHHRRHQRAPVPHYGRCRSPVRLHLGSGRFTFFVRARGPGGTDPTPARTTFAL